MATFSVEKTPASYEPYIFSLSDKYRALARQELGEDDDIREQSLAHLRQWIAKHPYIRKCRTDPTFLLRFLRFRKFSVPMAQAAIERYLAMRQTFPDWFQKMDSDDQLIQEAIDDEVFSIMGRDEVGRTVIWIRYGRFNVEKLNPVAMFRFTMVFLEALMDDEEIQIGGFRAWVDYTETTMKHFGMWGISDLKLLMDAINRSLPMRIREVQGAKLPKFAIAIANLALSFATPKLKNRVTCNRTVEESKQYFDKSLWPQQYGGTHNSTDIARNLRKLFAEKRAVILALDDMDIDIAHYSTLWNQANAAPGSDIDGGIAGCFRKLNVD
ncbi:clavesin-1-like [Sabethes cyaneus]|uniref:clavesin-1-like n=1 Tax=Sabethes cyaneus TaxID=53552 RepID=UPI00237E8B95|nr:clavesin-1-like [Sabethes cyaneus]